MCNCIPHLTDGVPSAIIHRFGFQPGYFSRRFRSVPGYIPGCSVPYGTNRSASSEPPTKRPASSALSLLLIKGSFHPFSVLTRGTFFPFALILYHMPVILRVTYDSFSNVFCVIFIIPVFPLSPVCIDFCSYLYNNGSAGMIRERGLC